MVPLQVLHSLDTVPQSISQKLPSDMSIHSLLALDMVLNKTVELTPWNAVMPDWASFETGVPFAWPEPLQELLPSAARTLLKGQQAKLRRDWSIVTAAFPSLDYDKFLHAWFLVNSRTFLYETPKTEEYPWDDRLALLPIADLFNHAETGCRMSQWPERYAITTDRNYRAGEELYLSYGDHSNDFLLAEYGFFLDKNRWDEVCIDDPLLARLNEKQKAELRQRDLLGNYTVRAETGACHRTQVALRLCCCTREQWLDFLDEKDNAAESQQKVDGLLIKVLSSFLSEAQDVTEKLGKLQVGLESQREILSRRWKQIENIIEQTMKLPQLCQVHGGAEEP
jgi:hypothetical protein